jgi:group I intron endonuclease
MKNVGDSFY